MSDLAEARRAVDGWRGSGRRRRAALRAPAASMLAVTLLLASPLLGCENEERHLPSILLLTLDTTRVDGLSLYDEERGNTPHLDALARESVVFERAITSAPYTGAAHATILTGLFSPQHGLRDFLNQAMPESIRTLPEILEEEGYETAAFVSTYVLDARYGLAQGFDVYSCDFWQQAPSRNYKGYPRGVRVEQPANATVDQALGWLSGRADPKRPFLLWLNLYDPHGPYKPPKAFRRPPPEDGPNRQVRRERRRYYDEVSYMDSEIGRLLNHLDRVGIMDELIVAVVADHGELLGYFGRPMHTHSSVLWDAVLRIPMMLRLPGRWSPAVVSATVRSADLMPTLLEAVGLPIPEDLAGRSLSPLVAGESEPPRPAYSETFFEKFPRRAKDGNELVSLQLESWKLITRPGYTRLYDLAEDPHEQEDQSSRRPEVLARMRDELERLKAGWPVDLEGRELPISSEREAAEHEARLRALGYVE